MAAFASEREESDEHGSATPVTSAVAPDYYAVLGVPSSASVDEIRQAFRRLAKLWHPDHYTTAPSALRERAERRMRALTRAYEVLSDPVRRHTYDSAHHPHVHHPGATIAPDAQPFPGSDYSPLPGVFGPHIVRPTVRATAADGVQPAARNTNGAGYLFGVLCLILIIALTGRTLGGGGAFDWGAALALVAAGVLGVIAMLFFFEDSPLARTANAYMEGEPAGYHDHATDHAHAPYRIAGEDLGDAPPTDFERLVDEALARVPVEFRSFLENVVVRVMEEPTPEQVEQMKLEPCSLLLGLYEGVPLTEAGADRAGPKVVTIFQRPIETYCSHIPSRIRRQVRATVLHELAHHFGIGHDAMPDWLK